MLFAFIIALSGSLFGIRISNRALNEKVITRTALAQIGTLYLLLLLVGVYVCRGSFFSLWVLVFLPLALFLFALSLLRKLRFQKFRDLFLEALQLIILKMKSAKSFRQSLSEVINESDFSLQTRLSEIRDIVVFSQQEKRVLRHPFIDLILQEFTNVDQNPHAAIRRLQIFRDRLQVEADFRRKSVQALKQIRAQSIIMSVLYLAILVFVSHEFGFVRNRNMILSSTLLFVCGLVWIHRGGRSLKWKV
jgi:Flp pilus assembly protein TadB